MLYLIRILVVLVVALTSSAHAQHPEVVIAQGALCDTQPLAERYTLLMLGNGKDGNKAAEQVNKEVGNNTACVLTKFAFVGQPEERGSVTANNGAVYPIKRLHVVGVFTPGFGWVMAGGDYYQYTVTPPA